MTAMRLKRYPSPSGGIALGKMGVGATMLKQGKTARDYVQDGLVAMWDGIENAGWGTHNASATVWKDLVGIRDLSLFNITVNDDNMLFANNSYAAGSNDSGLTSGIGTIELVMENTVLRTEISIMSLYAVGSYVDKHIYWRQSKIAYQDTPTGNTNCAAQSAVQWTPRYMAFVPPQNVFINGAAQEAQNATDYFGTRHSGGIVISPTTSYPPNGRVFRVSLYSRALSASEIAANYAIDKERFNLP